MLNKCTAHSARSSVYCNGSIDYILYDTIHPLIMLSTVIVQNVKNCGDKDARFTSPTQR